jgi:hypothetical protein
LPVKSDRHLGVPPQATRRRPRAGSGLLATRWSVSAPSRCASAVPRLAPSLPFRRRAPSSLTQEQSLRLCCAALVIREAQNSASFPQAWQCPVPRRCTVPPPHVALRRARARHASPSVAVACYCGGAACRMAEPAAEGGVGPNTAFACAATTCGRSSAGAMVDPQGGVQRSELPPPR